MRFFNCRPVGDSEYVAQGHMGERRSGARSCSTNVGHLCAWRPAVPKFQSLPGVERGAAGVGDSEGVAQGHLEERRSGARSCFTSLWELCACGPAG